MVPLPPAPPAADSAALAQAESVAALPAVVPAPPPAIAPPVAPPIVKLDSPRTTPASGSAFRWEWLAALAALLLLLAAALFLRSRAGRTASREAKPVVASSVVPTVVVRSRSGETSTASDTGPPLGDGRVKIGMIAGVTRPPEPEPGAAVLAPARLAVRMEDEVAVAAGAPPERVTAGAPLQVRMDDAAPTLERDEGAVILKRR